MAAASSKMGLELFDPLRHWSGGEESDEGEGPMAICSIHEPI